MTHHSRRTWVLAIDGSLDANRAADYVARWAHPLAVSDVYVLNVQPIGSYRAYALNRNETVLEATEQGTQTTAVARQVLDHAQVAYRIHTDLGEPADRIVAAAHSERASEILMGSRGMGAFANLALGSVAYKVIHLADMPVTLVSNPRQEPHLLAADKSGPQHVLLAVDGSEHAARAVEYVRQFANEGLSVEVTLINVQLPVQGHGMPVPAHDVIDSRYVEQGEAALLPAKRSLTNANVRFAAHIRSGNIAQAIARLAEESHCTRIVMGTRGLGTLANVVFGSVAYKVLHVAPVPVTLVK